MRSRTLLTMMVLAAVASLSCRLGTAEDASSVAADPGDVLSQPELATATAPDTFDVELVTSKGTVTIRVHREWAPHGADRFYNLVRAGYYDGCRFFRVIEGFMAQVGMHPEPTVNAAWSAVPIKDDPIVVPNLRGRVTFAARSAPGSRTTQFFVNTADNTRLAQHGPFAPFGEVIAGMEVVDALYADYGEGAPAGRGPSQQRLAAEGNEYLEREFPDLDAILSARLVE